MFYSLFETPEQVMRQHKAYDLGIAYALKASPRFLSCTDAQFVQGEHRLDDEAVICYLNGVDDAAAGLHDGK